jgi:lipopolysaccharide/colanic/teichoic acid biosynthesis glycosyltransferase
MSDVRLPFMRGASGEVNGPNRPTEISAGRRALDVMCAFGGMALLWPLMAMIGVAIKLTSRGPVLFRQRRIGENHQEFTILKFRTMRDLPGGPDVTTDRDARITGVGSFLRRTSLDELPQLLNVLRGEMTLVGPRPETPALASRYPEDCRWVLEHCPGLTGPTQIHPWEYNSVPSGAQDAERWYLNHLVVQRVANDATFLDNPTLSATISMVAQTVRHLFVSHGAIGPASAATHHQPRLKSQARDAQPQEGNPGRGASLETPAPSPLASQSNSASLLPRTPCAPSPSDQVSPSSPRRVIDGA